jgi:hypothetical protein
MRKCIVQSACVLAFLTSFCQCGQAAQFYLAGPNLIQDGNFDTLFGGPWNGTFGFPNTFYGDADGNGKYIFITDQAETSQSVATMVGITYQLTFASRIPQGPELNGSPTGPWNVGVYFNGSRAAVFGDQSSTVWSFFTLNFTATSSSTVVGFESPNQGCPCLDAVTMYATPEPTALTLGLLGLGMACVWRLRSRASV